MGFLKSNTGSQVNLSYDERKKLLSEIDINTDNEELQLLAKAVKDRLIKKKALEKLRAIYS